jgi:hypothetical protein
VSAAKKKEPARLAPPEKFHIDRRAEEVLALIGGADPNALLTTTEQSRLLKVSPQWLEGARHRGFGPPFVRLSERIVRYRLGATIEWLNKRTHQSTMEYATPSPKRKSPGRPKKSVRS